MPKTPTPKKKASRTKVATKRVASNPQASRKVMVGVIVLTTLAIIFTAMAFNRYG